VKSSSLALLVLLSSPLLPAPAFAQHKTNATGGSNSKAPKGGQATEGTVAPTVTDPKTGQKSKQYTFGGLDIDGKLKTPQLLYFLNRMKSEFDTTAPDKRSFIPELKRSTDEM